MLYLIIIKYPIDNLGFQRILYRTKTMNLLFTITSYPPSTGGGQIHTHQLAKGLKSKNEVEVIRFWDTNRNDWLLGTTLSVPSSPKNDVIDGISIHRLSFNLAEKMCMIPFVLAYYPLMDICVPALASILQPHIQEYTSQADLIHYVRIGREPLGFASITAAHQKDIPFIMTPLHHPRWGGWLHRLYHRLYRQSDALIALTEMEKRTLTSLGVAEERIFVTGIGPILAESSDGSRFRRMVNLGDCPIILFLGQKYVYKGVDTLLQAAKLVWQSQPETYFAFLGPRTSYSRQLFAAINDPRIIEMDTIDLQTKTDAIAACQVLCLPSSQESFGGVYTEAWSMGKPVVGCNIPAVAEIIRDGQNGYLTSKSPAEIADRLITLLKDPDLASKMGQAGRILVESRFTWKQIADQTETIYKKVLKS
jgi:glycosyltransferase involved in cell wall biosynthesis